MLFNSYVFIFAFLPITAAIYFLLVRMAWTRASLGWLVVTSLFFYGYWNPSYLPLIVGSIVFNYVVSSGIARDEWSRSARRLLLIFGVAANLGLIGYYKYSGFGVGVFAQLTGAAWDWPSIMLPLGISFFTFQQIAFLCDAWQGETKEYRFLDYCLFVTFFPQLIAGPIVHHKQVMPQFYSGDSTRGNPGDLAVGVTLFLMGLFKKVVLADSVAPFANEAFAAIDGGATPGMAAAWIGALSYTFQLYFDFSGYSDMAIGLGRIFGIKLPLNFNSPYRAVSIVDFWRRWHITLSQFLRDYLYIPLGGSRRGNVRRYGNLFATMLLGGLWHGAGWTFVFWGGLHGLYLCVNHAWDAWLDRNGRDRSLPVPVWRTATTQLMTFLAVIVAWVFFRSATFSGAWTMLAGMAGFHGLGLTLNSSFVIAVVLNAALLVIVWLAPNSVQVMRHFEPTTDWSRFRKQLIPVASRFDWVWRPSTRAAVCTALAGVVAILHMSRMAEFLYYQF